MQLRVEIYQDLSSEIHWVARSSNGVTVARSGHGYKEQRKCEEAVNSIFNCVVSDGRNYSTGAESPNGEWSTATVVYGRGCARP